MRMMWDFFQNQLLGMEWLHDLVGRGLTALGVDTTSRIGGSLWFFIYDSIKILVLLAVLIYAIGYVQSYFPPERTKKILGRFKGIGGNTMAALLGTVTPNRRTGSWSLTVRNTTQFPPINTPSATITATATGASITVPVQRL